MALNTFLYNFHVLTTFMMTGLILVIQFVHYPSFHWVDKSRFPKFTAFHGRRISFIVLPLMALELITSFFLQDQLGEHYFLNIGIIALIWASTFLLSVPLHQKLSKGKNTALIDRLIITNFPRTLGWSAKSLLLLYHWPTF